MLVVFCSNKSLCTYVRLFRQFMTAAETREKERHADVRYERFVRQTQGPAGSGGGSGMSVGGGTESNAGYNHTHRNNHHGKRGEAVKVQQVAPAAWLRNPDQDK